MQREEKTEEVFSRLDQFSPRIILTKYLKKHRRNIYSKLPLSDFIMDFPEIFLND